jgi:lipopolysaccharide transport system ATP-binding protein
MSQDVAVRLRGVEKTYRLYPSRRHAALDQLGVYRMRFWKDAPQWPDFTALRGVDIDIKRGERVGIVGRNGAGKTTLLKLVTGNFAPTTGTVEVRGEVQALMQTGIGFHPEFTGLENLRSALLYNGLTDERLEAAVEDVVEFAELGRFIHQPLRTYSLGMAARLEFAAATAISPDILIVDEVLGAGDGYFAHKSAARMRGLTNSGCTLLLVSHSLQQVLEFCERVVWLEKGAVRADGAAREILDEYAKSFSAVQGEAPRSSRADNESEVDLPFLRQAVVPHEPVDVSRDQETRIRLSDGRKVYRWPGRKGLEISGVQVLTADDRPPETGGQLQFHLTLEVAGTGRFEVVYRVAVYDLAGVPVCGFESPPDVFTATGPSTRKVRAELDPLLLGGREYVISMSVLDAPTLQVGDAPGARYDLISRSIRIGMRQTNDADPPYLHYPASWRFGTDDAPRPSRISGWQ